MNVNDQNPWRNGVERLLGHLEGRINANDQNLWRNGVERSLGQLEGRINEMSRSLESIQNQINNLCAEIPSSVVSLSHTPLTTKAEKERNE